MSEIPSPDKVMLEATYSDEYGKEQVEKLGLPAYLYVYRGKPIKVIIPKPETDASEADQHFVEWYIGKATFHESCLDRKDGANTAARASGRQYKVIAREEEKEKETKGLTNTEGGEMKYFALIWEDLSKTWQYYINDFDTLEELKEEMETALREGDLHPQSRIDIYKGEYVEVKLERPEWLDY